MTDEFRTVANVPCLACGCLCDDIGVTLRLGRIASAENACAIGSAWFLDPRHDRPGITSIDGREAGIDEAIGRAADLLASAKSPVILGMTGASLEAQRVAVAIADRIGATIDPGRFAESWPRWKAIQRVGMVSATLGEVRDRADVVVFWFADPMTTHPRHLERYSAHPAGRFVPAGRKGRTIAVVDASPSATSAIADRFVRVDRDDQAAALATLRGLVKGVEIEGVDDSLRDLATLMKSARYGAFFFDAGLGSAANVEEALKLVRDLNAGTRFVALALGSPGNAAGAEAALTWQAGSPVTVDCSAGYPRFAPDDASAEARLRRQQADVALIVMDDPGRTLASDEALSHLARIPVVAVSPESIWPPAAVHLACATPGIHSEGTILRSDGAALPLRPSLSTDLPSDFDCFARLLGRIEGRSP